MSSVVEICNLALSQLRSGSINSLEDPSVQAQQCSLHYASARDKVLSDFDWGFNNSTKALQLLTGRVFGWAFAWQYPNDCLHVNRLRRDEEDVEPDSNRSRLDPRLQLINQTNRVEYAIKYLDGAKVIVTNESDLYLDYRVKVTDVTLYSSDLRMAIAYLLAANMAVSLMGMKDGRVTRADMLALYSAFQTEEKAEAANQKQSIPTESEYITVRG
jgi:hypothetical protein